MYFLDGPEAGELVFGVEAMMGVIISGQMVYPGISRTGSLSLPGLLCD
jgi:hypothetical protein